MDAFVSSGFSPAELLRYLHPSEVASTQGTGFGGMTSMRRLYVDRFLGGEYPQDILQETLPNVVAAHTMQSYVGGYGSMIHPVGACATAAVSVEEGVDKITAGKATFVVAGAIDDVQVESLIGFGDMNASAHSQSMRDKGINERFFSRAGDLRREASSRERAVAPCCWPVAISPSSWACRFLVLWASCSPSRMASTPPSRPQARSACSRSRW